MHSACLLLPLADHQVRLTIYKGNSAAHQLRISSASWSFFSAKNEEKFFSKV